MDKIKNIDITTENPTYTTFAHTIRTQPTVPIARETTNTRFSEKRNLKISCVCEIRCNYEACWNKIRKLLLGKYFAPKE